MNKELIKKLAEFAPTEMPVLSVYLDMRPQATGGTPGVRSGEIVLKDRLYEIEKTYLPRGADLPLPHHKTNADPPQFDQLRGLPLTEAKGILIEQFERSAIEAALADNAGNVSAAARQLGLHRQSLQQKMTQWAINR